MLNSKQQEVLLKPLNSTRVAKRSGGGKSLSYLEAWDVKAHLIRIFGFGGWSWDVKVAELAFEEQGLSSKGTENWSVGYKVIGTLKIEALYATYTEAAVGFSTLPARGEAHDMAIKTAESDALKRAAINLGDQFGLSLYNNGSTNAVVRQTLAEGALDEAPVEAVDASNLEDDAETPEPAVSPASDTEAAEWADKFRDLMNAGDLEGVVGLKLEMQKANAGDLVFNGKTLAKIADIAAIEAGKKAVTTSLGGEEVTDNG